MSLWDRVTQFFTLQAFQEPELQTREASLEDLLQRATGTMRVRPWRFASTKEALGVPAIYRAVSLIANTAGALSLEAFRQGVKLANEDRPRIIVRPNPFTIPRDFTRDTAWNMASRGEAWWWVAARDVDDAALSVISVPPHEVTVTEDPRDLRYPVIEWRGKRIRNENMLQLTLNRDPDSPLRGVGPLQLCGAAVSVAVEAQEWAANFYADSGTPSTLIKSAVQLTEDEAEELRTRWISRPSNVPRVIDQGIEDVTQFEVNAQSSSMFEARDFQNAEAGRMFGVSASLLDIPIGGSSLTYQNLEQEFTKFVKTCLWPNYLEPIEQTMSDLLTRATVCRFNVDAFVRPDTKTRFEVYQLGIESGVMTPAQAAVKEGIEPGDVENAPMPFAPAQAIPSTLPIQMRSTDSPVRCPSCGKSRFVVESQEPFRGRCIRCKTVVSAPALEVRELAPAPAPVVDMTPVLVAIAELKAQPAPVMDTGPMAAAIAGLKAEPAPVVDMAPVTTALENLPERIAAALPRQGPQPAPQVIFAEGAFRAGDVHMPAGAEEAIAAAERVDKAAERVDKTEQAYLAALRDVRAEQPDFLAAMRQVAEENRPKPMRKRIIRDDEQRIIGVEDVVDD